MNNKEAKNKRKKYIIIPTIIIGIILISFVMIYIYTENLDNVKITEKVKVYEASDIDNFVDGESDYLPYYLSKNNITINDKLKIDSNDIFKFYDNDDLFKEEDNNDDVEDNDEDETPRFDYTIEVTNNSDIYNYQYKLKSGEKTTNTYKLFSAADNTQINQYYETSDGYILVVLKDIQYDSEYKNQRLGNASGNIEIQKYDNDDKFEWKYNIKANIDDSPFIEQFYEVNDKYYFVWADSVDHVLVLEKDGTEQKNISLKKYVSTELMGMFDNKIIFTTSKNKIISINLNTLEEVVERSYNASSDEQFLGYSDGTLYSYFNGILNMNSKNKIKKVNSKYDYDFLYKVKPYEYTTYTDFLNNYKYNDNYIYVPLAKTIKDSNDNYKFVAILVYDKNLKLINKIDISGKQYEIEKDIIMKYCSYNNIYFSKSNFSIFGEINGDVGGMYGIIETYDNNFNRIKINIFDEPDVSLYYWDEENFQEDMDETVNISSDSYSWYDTYYYKDRNYLKVINYKFN